MVLLIDKGRMKINEDGGRLEIIRTTHRDSGKYMCTAVSILGRDSKKVTLVVEGGWIMVSSILLSIQIQLLALCFRSLC